MNLLYFIGNLQRFVQEIVFRYQQKTDACRSASDVFEATIGDLERPPSSAESQAMSGQTTNEQEDEEENSSGNVKSLFCTKPFAIFKVNYFFRKFENKHFDLKIPGPYCRYHGRLSVEKLLHPIFWYGSDRQIVASLQK